jgi:hypothetical protein
LPELQTPLTDRFIRHNEPSCAQQLFDFAVAQAEAEVQLDTMVDDLSQETVVLVTVGRGCAHATSMAHQAGEHKPLNKLIMPPNSPQLS